MKSTCKVTVPEIDILKTIHSGAENLVNKGIHSSDSITNAEAKRLVLYTYLVLGDVILEMQRKEEKLKSSE